MLSGVALGAEAEVTKSWLPVLGEAANIVLTIVAPALTILVTALVWKLLAKFGIEKNVAVDLLMRKHIKQGINYADSWSVKQSEKPTGDLKLAEAIKHVLGLMGESKLPAMAEEKLKEMVEAQLTFDKKQAALPGV